MKEFVSGGVVLAALFTAAAAIAQPSPQTASAPQPQHARRSFFTSSQNRSDVPAHIERMFKGLDVNHDGFVTKDELASLKSQFDERASKNAPKRAEKAFARMDTDHDGKITQAEVDAARAARSAAKGKPVTSSRRAGSSLFLRADANKDGVVTKAEYLAAVASGKIKTRHSNMRGMAIVRLFDTADANKDGRLSLDEAKQAALQHFDAADVNHDGVLTPDERRQASKTERAKRRSA